MQIQDPLYAKVISIEPTFNSDISKLFNKKNQENLITIILQDKQDLKTHLIIPFSIKIINDLKNDLLNKDIKLTTAYYKYNDKMWTDYNLNDLNNDISYSFCGPFNDLLEYLNN